MSASHSVLDWLRQHKWAVYGLIFFVFLLAHFVIFRDAVFAIPEILRGDSVIVREELVPFFDFDTQFWPEGTAGLTSSEEVRVVYSFWTSWMRHYAVLPFALVLLNALSAFVLFYAFYRIGRYFGLKRPFATMLVAALAAFLIHFVLLYAKLTHFYTLVFGFSLFALAMSFMLEQLFFRRDISKRNVAIVSLLVLFNPAIHYHVIFYFIFAFFVLLHCAVNLVFNRAYAGFYCKRNLIYFAVITALSLVPYVAFILIAGGSGASSVSTNIPVNYWMIYYSSVALTSLFALDTAAQIDMFRYGAYVIPSPRVTGMVVIFLIAWLFVSRHWKILHISKRMFMIVLSLALLLSVWMAMGYSADFSFHTIVGGLAMYLTDQTNLISQLFGQAIATFINILRFPHRFQFIFFYLVGVLLTIALVWVFESVRQKRTTPVAVAAVVLLALSPLLAARDYFTVATSGNFASFLQPYRISPDLKEIRAQLASQQNTMLFILPTLESGRDLIVDGQRHGFIDKFLIYYLNQPTLYYGTGGNPEHKVVSYAVYRGIEDAQPWWDDVLVNSLGITHILQPKHASERSIGFSYMPEVDEAITDRLGENSLFQKTYDGADFALYEATSRPGNETALVDMQWKELTERLAGEPVSDKMFFPMQFGALAKDDQEALLISDSIERSYYNFYTMRHPENTFYPNTAQLAFSKDIVASSNFTVNALSMSTLNNKYDEYNYIGERFPSLLNTLTSQFIGVPAGNRGIPTSLSAPQAGSYRVLLRAASGTDSIVGAVNNQGVVFEKIADDRGKHGDYIDMTYFYADLELQKGDNTIMLHNPGDHALAVESLTRLSPADLPKDFAGPINQAGIRITPTAQPNEYNAIMEAR